jgi:hypothetical protein
MNLTGNLFRTPRLFSVVLATFVAAGALSVGAAPAHADKEKTWRYVTYGLGAATAYMAVKKKTVPAVIGAAGTYLAYKKWNDAKNDRREREYWGYGRGRGRGGYSRSRYDRSYRYESRGRGRDDYRYSRRRGDYRYSRR